MLISFSVLFVQVKEFQRNQFTQKQCARGSLMRITRHTKIETPKRKMKQNFVLQYLLYACTNVTKRVNREINARRDERMQGVWIGENKICSIGLSFLRWTSRHGLTINCDTPPGRVEMVSGCGLGTDTTTSLSALGYNISRNSILDKLLEDTSALSRNLLENE